MAEQKTSVEKMEKASKAMGQIGCLMVIFVTIPILILFFLMLK